MLIDKCILDAIPSFSHYLLKHCDLFIVLLAMLIELMN